VLIPNLSDQPLRNIDQSIVQKKNQFYNAAILANIAFQQEADLNTRFYVGEQTLMYDLYGDMPNFRRKRFNFNRSKTIIDTVDGTQRQGRKSIIVTPIENGSQKTADQFTKIFVWLSQREKLLETISDAFQMALIQGMSFLEIYLDWRNDPVNGDLKIEAAPYNSWVVDPMFRKYDMSDCSAIIRRKYMTKADIASIMPNSIEVISSLKSASWPSRDGKFQYMPENLNPSSSDRVAVDEYWYRAYRSQEMLMDEETGECMEWTGDSEQLAIFQASYPSVNVVKQMIPTVNQALFVQDYCIADGPNPLGIDEYPLVPMIHTYRSELPYLSMRITSMMTQLRDVQYLYTRRRIIEMDMLESQITTGYIYKPDSMINPNDIYEQSGQGKGIALKKGAEMTDVIKMPPPTLPPFEMSQVLEQDFNKVSGISEAMLGANIDKNISGILEKIRQKASLVSLEGIFDNLDKSQAILGDLLLKIIQINWTPRKIERILNEEPTREFYTKNFGKYYCVVEDGLNTTTQKQMQFAILMQIKELGIAIPDDVLLDAVTVPNKEELKKSIQQQAQLKAQLEQQQQQIAMQELQSRAKLSESRALADQGLYLERQSRQYENYAAAEERKHKAVAEDHAGMLDLVKTIKELENIDLTNIRQLIEMSQMLKAAETAVASSTEKQPIVSQSNPQIQPNIQSQSQTMGQ
jgi:hypothetical protein